MSKKTVAIVQSSSGQVLLEKARWCSSFWCKLVGFQFRKKLKPGEALLMVYPRDSVRSTSIHMFFVFTPLAVIWINSAGRVTHTQLALPWRPYYASPEPARYVLETQPGLLGQFSPGDQVQLVR